MGSGGRIRTSRGEVRSVDRGGARRAGRARWAALAALAATLLPALPARSATGPPALAVASAAADGPADTIVVLRPGVALGPLLGALGLSDGGPTGAALTGGQRRRRAVRTYHAIF